MAESPEAFDARTAWFPRARLGTFIHFGPYARYGRGEQVLFRENLDQDAYAEKAMAWTAPKFDADDWTRVFQEGGSRYAVLTTRHHDGFCLWNTKTTDYHSVNGAAQKDFVGEYVEAMRRRGLKVGLYYSLCDWRIPAYWAGPGRDPDGFRQFVEYVHEQVREIVTGYGSLDMLWFDGSWPYWAEEWKSFDLVRMIRSHQPNVMINNRLGPSRGMHPAAKATEEVGHATHPDLFDYGTPEREIRADGKYWESCDPCTWRLWGYARGERFMDPEILIDRIARTASMGGNFLLNCAPQADGDLSPGYRQTMRAIGAWVADNGEAIYGSEVAHLYGREDGNLVEFVTRGWQILKGKSLYLVIRFEDGEPTLELPGIATPVLGATLLGSSQKIAVRQEGHRITLTGLPVPLTGKALPVIRLDFSEKPKAFGPFRNRLWQGDATRMLPWAEARRKTSSPFHFR